MTYSGEIKDIAKSIPEDEKHEWGNVEKLEVVRDLLTLAVDLSYDVARATNDDNAETYFCDHLKILSTSSHGFLSDDFNIDQWIDRVERGDIDEEDDED